MEAIFGTLMTLSMLVLLQAVLGFDNLLYISIESRRAPEADQSRVRHLGIGLAVVLRIALLFALIHVIDKFDSTLFSIPGSGLVQGIFTLQSLIVLAGGVFIIYTALKEIFHMIALHDLSQDIGERKPTSVKMVVGRIVLMNLVFSFDSILSAMALTDKFWVMAVAILIGGVLMVWLADRVSQFLQRNRAYEVLGLFILFIVGIMLLSEGGELAGLSLFGHEVQKMSKATFYFVIGVLVLTDIVQGRYQQKLLKLNEMPGS